MATVNGTSQGMRSIGRSATVTPSANSAHGAAAFCRNCISRSSATGGWKCIAAEATPSTVAMMNGCSTMRRTICTTAPPSVAFPGAATVISKGTSTNSNSVSKQKISATGTFAAEPSVASARPGPM